MTSNHTTNMTSTSPSSRSSSHFHPDEWSDQKRARALMSPFRSRDANPENYDTKLAFWKRNISAWSSSQRVISFSVGDVRQAFARDGLLPDETCIKHVLSQMMKQQEIRKRDEVEDMLHQRVTASGWSSFVVGIITKPLSWGISYLTSSDAPLDESGPNLIEDDQVFVQMSSLSEAAESLFREFTGTRNEKQIWKMSELQEKAAAIGISKSDLQLLLLYLQSEKKACLTDDCGTRLIKLADAAAFSQLELGLYRLESAKELLEKDVRQIETEMSSLKEEARQAVNRNNRSQATQILRRKKRLENLLVKKESQLDNIHVLLQQMSDSDSNVMILKTFQQAADVLKCVQSSGPVAEEVDQTMLDVDDVVQNALSLQSDLSRAIGPDLDEGLDQELQDILNSDHNPDPADHKEKESDGDAVDDLLFRLQQLRTPESSNPLPQLSVLSAVPRRHKAPASDSAS